jgi:hypothetical protein
VSLPALQKNSSSLRLCGADFRASIRHLTTALDNSLCNNLPCSLLLMPMAPRRRSPSVEARRRPERRHSRDRDRTTRDRDNRSPVPDSSARGRHDFSTSISATRRHDYRAARPLSRERPRRRSRASSPSGSPHRAPRTDVYRPDKPAPTRHREDSVPSVKRRRETSTSPSRDRSRKHQRRSSIDGHRTPSPAQRYE